MVGIIVPYNIWAAATITHDPQAFAQAYAQFVESIEKYNNMIKTAQDTLNTMNRINDIMNTANSTLNNLQTGLADPRQLADRFQANINSIKENAERIGKSLEQRNWSETILKKEYASCKKKWQNLVKEMKELKQEIATENLTNANSEESSQIANQTFGDERLIKEIEADLQAVENAYNGSMNSVNEKLNQWANNAQYYVDIGDIETKMREHKNPYQTQANVCNKIDETEIEFRIYQAKNKYWEAIANGEYQTARKEFDNWRRAGLDKEMYRKKQMEKVLQNTQETFNAPNNKEALLTINEDSGELSPKDKWESLGYDSKDKVAESKTIYITDDKGNTTTLTKWVAKQSTIYALFDRGMRNEALNLQNQRNMAVALQGDSQAIQQMQLETLQLLGVQINALNHSVNQIGNVVNEFLQQQINSKDDNIEHLGSENRLYGGINDENEFKSKLKNNLNTLGFGSFDDILEEDSQSGRIRFKHTNKDTSGIIGD